MEPVTALVDGDVLVIHLPSPEKPLKPPIVAMDRAKTGYDGRDPHEPRTSVIADDDRIGLLGANGNGKSTFAKLIAGRLGAMEGSIRRSQKMEVGFFAQHQVDDLDEPRRPTAACSTLMKNVPARRRSARQVRATRLSAEREGRHQGRDALGRREGAAADGPALVPCGPHLLIMDEPTNHLDIDSRAALIEAINAYKGAVILVSHDRYLLDACADRLWQVADGAVTPFDGDMDDYKAQVLGTDKPKPKAEKTTSPQPGPGRTAPGQAVPAKKRVAALEERMAKYQDLIGRIDRALADRDAFIAQPQKAAQLAKQRGELAKALATAEEDWLMLSAEREAAQ